MARLPRWATDNHASVEREAAPYRDMTEVERFEQTASACRTAAVLLESRADRDVVLGYRDPLPKSTVQALARLREQYRRRSGKKVRGD